MKKSVTLSIMIALLGSFSAMSQCHYFSYNPIHGRLDCYPTPFGSTVPGTVPASGGGTVNFLRADGTWAPVGALTGSIGYWGSFYDTSDQLNAGATSENLITVNSYDPLNNGVSMVDGSKLTFANAGVYNVQFSAQFVKSDSNNDDVDIWIKKNGVNVPFTNSFITLTGNNGKLIAAWNFVLSVNSGDYIQFYWHSADTAVSMQHIDGQLTPTRPDTPSIIVTAQMVTYVQSAGSALEVGSSIASASAIAPTKSITHITGTTAVSTITVPISFTGTNRGGCLTLIPDGAWSTNTAGNIALATTAVVNKALTMCYDGNTSKWYPSY
jgi:hypothetical protein